MPGVPSGSTTTSLSTPCRRRNDNARNRSRSNGCPSSITVTSHGSIARSCCSLSPALSAPARPSPCARPPPTWTVPARVHLPGQPHRRGARHAHPHRRRARAHPEPITATLAPQAADALATEHAERGRNPGHRGRHYRPGLNPYTPFVLRDFGLVAWLFTNRIRNVRHVRIGRRRMARRVVIGELRVQRIDRDGGRRSWTIVWPDGREHSEADRFLREHDGVGRPTHLCLPSGRSPALD